jgi:hypothetical protein
MKIFTQGGKKMKSMRVLIKMGVSIGIICGILWGVSFLQQVVRGQGRYMMHIKRRAPSPEEIKAIILLRKIAKSKDKSQIDLILKYLQSPSEEVRALTALVVGRLGIQEFEKELQRLLNGQEYERSAAKIALARLKAEVSTADPSEQINIFLEELDINPSYLKGAGWERKARDLSPSFETIVLRELADIVARANQRGIDMSTWEKKIPFEVDYPSALKVKLSKMKQKERIAYLIQNILTLRPTWERECDAQALADEGNAAIPVIIATLQKIHEEIKQNGFTKSRGAALLLIHALGCIGDECSLSILRAFMDQPGILWYHPQKPIDHFIQGAAKFAIQSIKSQKKYYISLDYW